MDINHIYFQNNINNLYQNSIFKDFDKEIYTIKDINQKKITDIIREVQNRKDIEKPHISLEKKEHNQKLFDSMKKINELYYNLFDIKDLKKQYEIQKEKKYQQFKKYIYSKSKKDSQQKIVDETLIENLKKLKEKNKNDKINNDKNETEIE